MEPIKLIIAEDDFSLRSALLDILNDHHEVRVVGSAADGEQALQLALQYEPRVALMDINMPRLNGIEATRRMKRLLPDIQVVIWTIYGDDQNLFEAIKAGAIGYLLKDSPPEEVIASICSAARGESRLHPAVANRVLQEFQRVQTQHSRAIHLLSELTERETEILKMIAEGKRNKEIADALYVSEKTVKNYMTNILYKLQVNSRTEAALLAIKEGLV